MLKLILTLVLLGCLIWTNGVTCFSQTPAIKRITYNSKDLHDQITKIWVHVFDRSGNQVEGFSYDRNGKLISASSKFYNEAGRLVKETSKTLQDFTGEPDSSGCITNYYYDAQGHFLKDSTEEFNQAFCLPSLLWLGFAGDKVIYDANDSVVEIINYQFKKKDKMRTRKVHSYDSVGIKISTTYFSYDDNGSLEKMDSTLHFYSESGRLERDTSFHFQGDSVFYVGVDYDKYGNELQRRRYQAIKVGKKAPKNLRIVFQSVHSYIYDKWGIWIEKNYRTSRGMMAEKITRIIEYY